MDKTSGAKNLVSTRFFTLSNMSKRSYAETPEEKSAEAVSPMGSADVCGVST